MNCALARPAKSPPLRGLRQLKALSKPFSLVRRRRCRSPRYRRCTGVGRPAPQFGLRLLHHGRETRQIAEIDREPHAVLEARILRLGDGLDIEERATSARLWILDEFIGGRNENEVSCPCAKVPGTLRLDGACSFERSDTVRSLR